MLRRSASIVRLAVRAMLGLAALAVAVSPAQALTRGAYSMEILVDGLPLDEHAARATTYVEALREREYAVRLTNHSGGRVAIALSVDGLNSIDAKSTPAYQASRWILDPYESITIDGWQTSDSSARRFFFTTEDRSYGAWLGRTRNLGLIAAAVFREKRPQPIQQPGRRSDRPQGADGESREGVEPPVRGRPSEAEGRAPGSSKAADAAERLGEEPSLSDRLAATGIGREVAHPVRQVRFDAERSPAALLELRYEYRPALVRLGLLPRPAARCDDPLSRREGARGFPDHGFAPDPFLRPKR